MREEHQINIKKAQVAVDQNNGKFFTLYHGKDIYLELWVDMGDDEKIVTFVDAPFNTGSHATCYLDMSRNNWQPPYFGSEEGFATWKAGGSFRAVRPQWSLKSRFNQKVRYKK